MYRSLPIASFRPRRYQRRPCDSDYLPPDRGDACFFRQAGFASFAGQTKRGCPEAAPNLQLRLISVVKQTLDIVVVHVVLVVELGTGVNV